MFEVSSIGNSATLMMWLIINLINAVITYVKSHQKSRWPKNDQNLLRLNTIIYNYCYRLPVCDVRCFPGVIAWWDIVIVVYQVSFSRIVHLPPLQSVISYFPEWVITIPTEGLWTGYFLLLMFRVGGESNSDTIIRTRKGENKIFFFQCRKSEK